MNAQHRRLLAPCLAFALLLAVLFPWYYDDLSTWTGGLWSEQNQFRAASPAQHTNYTSNVEVVVASLKSEDTSWLSTHLPDWKTNIYVVDDRKASLTVPKNQGHESMVYLTYIIDHYDHLPNNIIFMHASRFAWHNDDPDYDAIPTLRNLQLPYLQENGYVNLRCVWVIGCPAEIRPVEDEANRDDAHPMTKDIYKQAFDELLPDLPMPEVVGVSCCSQFAVTRETIQSRPQSDYVRYRQWLLETSLDDGRSGRVLEFSWHIIFGKEPVYCPSASDCYCKVFGLCDLSCSDGSCDGRYTLPPYSTLPAGWPRIGWNGEARDFNGPLD
ncbi:hypothetical protein BJ166DRAFT_57333 [Pestalotiopsis sp. NC0098]|nr:hypothetical protein BJ166DRAFT_57333 [Pestalotiopsis sp. NC0098]